MLKVQFYERYGDVVSGFYTSRIYNDWEYQNIINDMLMSNAATFSIRKV